MQYVEIDKIITDESPREIIADHFQSLRGELPIRGGWGYSQEDAVIIDKNDPTVIPGMPFDCVGIEHIFIEKRIYEELIIFRPENDRFTKIQWDLKTQELIEIDNRVYDKLIYSITAWRDRDYEALQKERNPEWDLDNLESAPLLKHNAPNNQDRDRFKFFSSKDLFKKTYEEMFREAYEKIDWDSPENEPKLPNEDSGSQEREPSAEKLAFDKKCSELQVVYEREYWFDITSTWARTK